MDHLDSALIRRARTSYPPHRRCPRATPLRLIVSGYSILGTPLGPLRFQASRVGHEQHNILHETTHASRLNRLLAPCRGRLSRWKRPKPCVVAMKSACGLYAEGLRATMLIRMNLFRLQVRRKWEILVNSHLLQDTPSNHRLPVFGMKP